MPFIAVTCMSTLVIEHLSSMPIAWEQSQAWKWNQTRDKKEIEGRNEEEQRGMKGVGRGRGKWPIYIMPNQKLST